MNTRITRSTCAALLALASFSANAIETFFGEDLVAGSASAARPNSLAAHDSFLTRVGGTARTENFDTQALGNAAGMTLNLGSAGTATLSGFAIVANATTDGGAGRFAISGSQYIQTTSGFTITFSQPQTAFGFYATDVGDFNGQLSITYSNGSSQTVAVPHSKGSANDGAAFFFGMLDPGNPFTSVVFINSDTNDVFGFDDLIAGLASLAITTTSLPAANVLTAYTPLQLTAAGGLAPITWQASGLPPGMSLSSTGLLSGTPSTPGSFNVDFLVTDSSTPTKLTAAATLTLVVNAAPLSITSATTLPAAVVGTPYSQTLTATGGLAPLTWSVTGLPAGLVFDANTGVISGTPSLPLATPATLTVSVSDSSATPVIAGPQTMTLAVNAAGLSITSSTQMPDANVGQPYSLAMAATGGLQPLTWSATGLPAGLSIDPATGVISGTPTDVKSAAQSAHTKAALTVLVSVHDSSTPALQAQQTMSLTVHAAPSAVITPVPTLGAWSLAVLALLAGALGSNTQRRKVRN